MLGVGAFALGAITGCGGDPAGQTDLAKLPPPSQAVIDRAKAAPLPKSRPKFGSPPKSEMGVPKTSP
jgi:hypothetical protein